MARRRMFSIDVVETDSFLDLPVSAQNLYFHLALNADDDGFITNARRIQALIGAESKDLDALKSSGFIIVFDAGVYAITHWHVMNEIRKDRYKPTINSNEYKQLRINTNGAYELYDT
jgi:hypothetical protein